MRPIAVASVLAVSIGSTATAQVNVTVDASAAVRTVDGRVFGLNTASWDWSLDTGVALVEVYDVEPVVEVMARAGD